MSALKDFSRSFEETSGGKGRFWWQRKGDTKKLPEWIILEHKDNEVNFERTWYAKCEKKEEVLKKLKAAGYERDWLETLDEKNDFSVGMKKGHEYP